MNGTLKVAAYWQFPFCRRCFWNLLLLQLLLLLLNVLISFGDPLLECSDLRTLGKIWNYVVVGSDQGHLNII